MEQHIATLEVTALGQGIFTAHNLISSVSLCTDQTK